MYMGDIVGRGCADGCSAGKSRVQPQAHLKIQKLLGIFLTTGWKAGQGGGTVAVIEVVYVVLGRGGNLPKK